MVVAAEIVEVVEVLVAAEVVEVGVVVVLVAAEVVRIVVVATVLLCGCLLFEHVWLGSVLICGFL